jgi:uncharacterized membrane protein
MNALIQLLRKYYNKSIHSVGIYPSPISLLFLIAFILLYQFEYTVAGTAIKHRFDWLNIRTPESARAILTTVAGGIIGLAVFSFSMVMVVISQAASQISNRLLDNLIGNKYQQIVLGFYLGTVVAAFFLLMVTDDKGQHNLPSLTIFFLAALAIVDLFLFVIFLHYITQSTRYEKLIENIHGQTADSISEFGTKEKAAVWEAKYPECGTICSPRSDYFQGISAAQLMRYLDGKNLQLAFIPYRCTYVVKGEPLLKIYAAEMPGENTVEEILKNVDFYTGQEIDKNPFYGFLHLAEVAIKALSPAINDPNTAVLSVHALTDLFLRRLETPPLPVFCDASGGSLIMVPEKSFDELFRYCVYPIWDYGKHDRFVQQAMQQMLGQLKAVSGAGDHQSTLEQFGKLIGKVSEP